jgi:hypothetical protein
MRSSYCPKAITCLKDRLQVPIAFSLELDASFQTDRSVFSVECSATSIDQVDRVKEIVHGKLEVIDWRSASLVEELATPTEKYGGLQVIREVNLMLLWLHDFTS